MADHAEIRRNVEIARSIYREMPIEHARKDVLELLESNAAELKRWEAEPAKELKEQIALCHSSLQEMLLLYEYIRFDFEEISAQYLKEMNGEFKTIGFDFESRVHLVVKAAEPTVYVYEEMKEGNSFPSVYHYLIDHWGIDWYYVNAALIAKGLPPVERKPRK